jgi:hypothetical protein
MKKTVQPKDKLKVRRKTKATISPSVKVVEAVTEPIPEPVISVVPTNKPKHSIKWGWWLFIVGGILLVLLGMGISAMIYSANRSSPAVLLGVGIAAFGGWVIFRGFKGDAGFSFGHGHDLVATDTMIPKATGQENCLNIYPRHKGGIKFEHMENPEGIPQQCENDGKWYFVHIWKKDEKKLVAFSLPDMKNYDPKEFANIFDAEPIRRFFEIRWMTLEKFAPWVFLAMCGIFLFAIIIIPGALSGG